MRDNGRSEKEPIEETQELRAGKAKLERLRPESNGHKKPELPLATVGATGEKARRKTGIDILGEVPWGTHSCVFYQSKQDLIDILVPYFKEGLENNEFCMWITSEPLSAEEAEKSLSQAVTNLDDYIKKGQIEILDYSDWYTKSGAFKADSVLQGWLQKHDQAIKNGFDGLRLTGNTLWLEKQNRVKFADYEAVINSVIGKYRMLAICTYCLDKCGASEILEVEHNHQFSLIKWQGDWKILESSSHNQLETRLAKQTAIAKALERSKKDWVRTFNAISDWVAMIDLKGRILRTNHAGENFTGKTLDEIIGQSCCKLVHGQDKHIPGYPLRTMLHTRQRATMELNVPNTNRWLMVTVDPVVDGRGNLVGAVHITRDITKRKQAEEAVRESKERLIRAEQVANIGHWDRDFLNNKVRWSDHLYRIFGVDPEKFEPTYEAFLNLVHPDDRERVNKISTFAAIDKQPLKTNYRIVRPDGTQHTVESQGEIYSDKNEKVTRIFGTIQDITERKKAEEALCEREQFLKNIFDAIQDGLSVLDHDLNIIRVNPWMEELYSNKVPFVGKKCYKEYQDRDSVCPWCPCVRAIDTGQVQTGIVPSPRQDKTTGWCELTAFPLKDKNGRIMGVIEHVKDITEHKQAEEAVIEYQGKLKSSTSELFLAEERERRRIADGIHDDIGTKLALAKFELQSLMKGPAETAIAASLESVCAEIDKVIEDAHSLTFELSNPVLYEVGLDAAIESWLGRHIHKKSQLKYEVASEPSPMKPDEETRVVLFRVIRELLTNVIKHADASILEVNIQKDGETIRVSIEDDGVGFEMSEPGLPVKETGGFGLFNVREKVEYLGGRIEIESKPGEGTCVRISVPVQQGMSR